jgi:hypothetical protein
MPALRVHHLVELEFNEARAWYATRSVLAAENFSLRFAAALQRVETGPTAHALWRAGFRRARLLRFPYLILFQTDERVTSVLALVHQRREPSMVLAAADDRLAHFA